MKIGIIGAGQIGGTLTRRLTALGHEVFVDADGVRRALARASRNRTPEFLSTVNSPGSFAKPA